MSGFKLEIYICCIFEVHNDDDAIGDWSSQDDCKMISLTVKSLYF